MGRAVVVNIWTGTLAQGGSTITQQLVKNRWHPAQAADRSLRRKIIESALAYQVEQHWSKQKILEEYLNTIYFGHQAYGVEAAAEVYFGVHAKDLQPHQAALLAALIQNPTANDPLLHPKVATERRKLVLGKMLEQGYIDTFEYQLADSKPLLPRGPPDRLPGREEDDRELLRRLRAPAADQRLRARARARRRPARLHDAQPAHAAPGAQAPCARRCRSAARRPRWSRSTRPRARCAR